MPTIHSFTEIEAWKKARELTKAVYRASGSSAFGRDFGLQDQIRRASVSVMSNIAEGFERGGTVEFVRFLSIAKGSAGEVESQFYVALDQGYLDQRSFAEMIGLVGSTKRLIGGFMTYLRNSGLRGVTKTRSQTRSARPGTTRNPEPGTE